MRSESRLYRRLRLAGLLVVGGLAIQAISLTWVHPTAFFLFAFLGTVPVAAGVLLYLTSLARLAVAEEEGD